MVVTPGCGLVRGGASGFTLLEMLIAVSIFAMIATVIFSSFNVGIGAWERGERDSALYQKLRATADLLHREITSAHPYFITPGELDTHKKYMIFFGASDSLQFVSQSDLHKRTGGLSLLELWVDEDRGLMIGEEAALISSYSELEDINLRDEDRSHVLCPEVKKVVFRYFEREKPDEEGEWVDRWDPRDKSFRLPVAVEVVMMLRDVRENEREHRFVVPVMTVLQ